MKKRIQSLHLPGFLKESYAKWDKSAFFYRSDDSHFTPLFYPDLLESALNISEALIHQVGVQALDRIPIFSDNCVEWIIISSAIQFAGVIDVPRAKNIEVSEIIYILNHVEAKVCVLENETLLSLISPIIHELPLLQEIILLRSNNHDCFENIHLKIHQMNELKKEGRNLRTNGSRESEVRMNNISPTDIYTIIYTSGTTGQPKGVSLTHSGIISQINNLPIHFRPNDKTITILPIWHIYERVYEMLCISSGVSIYYSSFRSLYQDFQCIQPTIFSATPRLLEAFYEKIIHSISNQIWYQKIIFYIAYHSHRICVESSFFFHTFSKHLKKNPFFAIICALGNIFIWISLFLISRFFFNTVLKKVRLHICTNLQFIISGGASLPLHIDEFFYYIGIPILEGYGLTESGTILAMRKQPLRSMFGTVGILFPETEIKFVHSEQSIHSQYNDSNEDQVGEIYVKGPQIMSGYYHDLEQTEKVLINGWLATGDLGKMTAEGYLKILGRCKETIVLLGGENIEPSPIEIKLQSSPFIHQSMVVGHGRKQLGLLVVPCLESFQSKEIQTHTITELISSPQIHNTIQNEIKKIISKKNGFKDFERISKFYLLSTPFEVGRELTLTFKLKRSFIEKKYERIIDLMFQ